MILPRKARFARRPALGRRFIRDNQAFASFHQSDSADNPRARNFSVHPKPGQRRDLQKIRAFIEQRLDPLPPFGLANSTMVVGNDGVIIIDTLESLTSARNVAAAFRAIGSKPVKAVVYTHNHTDHILGIKAFVKEEDVRSGAVTVFAHSTMMQTAIGNASIIGPILSVRSAYSLGLLLPVGPEGLVNSGLGPRLVAGEPSFIAPTKTFDHSLDVVVSGVKMHLVYAPSETDDEIVAWFPDWRLLQSAEVIQGETFPNLHTLRGTKYRDPVKWFKSIDK